MSLNAGKGKFNTSKSASGQRQGCGSLRVWFFLSQNIRLSGPGFFQRVDNGIPFLERFYPQGVLWSRKGRKITHVFLLELHNEHRLFKGSEKSRSKETQHFPSFFHHCRARPQAQSSTQGPRFTAPAMQFFFLLRAYGTTRLLCLNKLCQHPFPLSFLERIQEGKKVVSATFLLKVPSFKVLLTCSLLQI